MSKKSRKHKQLSVQPQAVAVAAPSLYGVDAEIHRPIDGRGQFQVFAGCIQLSAEIMNALYQAALAATPDMSGEITTISIKVVHPDAERILAECRRKTAPVPTQPTLRLIPDNVPLDSETDDDLLDEPEDPCDGIDRLLGQTEGAPRDPDERLSLAFDIYELALTWDVDDDVESLWEWFETHLLGLYQRLGQSSKGPRDATQRLNLAANILGLADENGIDIENSPAVWQWYQFNCHLQHDLNMDVPIVVLNEEPS